MLDVQAVARLVFKLERKGWLRKGGDLADDDVTREAEQRLAAALERIADMAHQGLSRTPAPPLPAERAGTPSTGEIVARLDSLIERLRAALGSHAAS